MAYHPLNLALRLLLELASVAGLFRLGLWIDNGPVGFGLAVAFVVVAVAAWGIFAVPGDRSRSGAAPVPVSGWVRLIVEIGFFSAGTAAWFVTGPRWIATLLVIALAIHHLVSWERIRWLHTARGWDRPSCPRT